MKQPSLKTHQRLEAAFVAVGTAMLFFMLAVCI